MLVAEKNFDVETRKLRAASSFIPQLRADGPALSERRSLSPEFLERMDELGLLSLLRPARFGGDQLSLKAAIQVSRELALGDGSVAWVHGVYMTHDHIIGLFPEAVQEEYWASAKTPLSASSYVPSGKAVPVDGGYALTGTWSFCSGIDHANWTVVGAIVGMLPGEPPVPDRRLFLVPASSYRIVDDWHVMGLRGTGSKSIVLEQAFVPTERVISEADIARCGTPGVEKQTAKEFKYPTWPLLNFTLVGLASKIARHAYEAALGEIKAGAGKPNPLFDSRRAAAGMHLAEASAKIDAAELVYSRALDETFSIVDAAEELTMELRIRNRRDQCFSVRLAQEAGALLLNIGGARGLRDGAPVQRLYRDLCAIALHPSSNWDATALSFGSVALGGMPTEVIV